MSSTGCWTGQSAAAPGHEGATAPSNTANDKKQDHTATKKFGLRGGEVGGRGGMGQMCGEQDRIMIRGRGSTDWDLHEVGLFDADRSTAMIAHMLDRKS